jgi:hypothetical protein
VSARGENRPEAGRKPVRGLSNRPGQAGYPNGARFFVFDAFACVVRADASPPPHRGCLKDSLKHCATLNHGPTPHLKACATLPTIPHWRRCATLPRADLPHGQRCATLACRNRIQPSLLWRRIASDLGRRPTGNAVQWPMLGLRRPTGNGLRTAEKAFATHVQQGVSVVTNSSAASRREGCGNNRRTLFMILNSDISSDSAHSDFVGFDLVVLDKSCHFFIS